VTARTSFREMAATQKVAYVIGVAIAAVIGHGVVALLTGLLWRAVVAVWT
jgi:hypothetical protein